MTNNHFTLFAHTRADETEFAVTVSTLVRVHVVHVDAAPRQTSIKLGMQVQPWLFQLVQAGNPHFRRREGVHP